MEGDLDALLDDTVALGFLSKDTNMVALKYVKFCSVH